MKYIMKKNFMRKEFILLLTFASIVTISESQAAQLKCPVPNKIEVHQVDKAFLYQGMSHSQNKEYKVPFEGMFDRDESKSKDFKLEMLYKTENGQLACGYSFKDDPRLIELKTSDVKANANCKRADVDDMFFTCK